MGIGDWAIPNPQSPIPNPHYIKETYFKLIYYGFRKLITKLTKQEN